MNIAHISTKYHLKIHFNIIFTSKPRTSKFSFLPNKTPLKYLLSPMHATRFAQFLPLYATKHLNVGRLPPCSQSLAVNLNIPPQYLPIRQPQSIFSLLNLTSTERHINSVFCIFYSFHFYISDGTTRDSEVKGKGKCLKKISTFIPAV